MRTAGRLSGMSAASPATADQRISHPAPARPRVAWRGFWLLAGLLWLVSMAGAQTVLPDTLRPATGHAYRLSEFSGPFWVNQRSVVLPGDTLFAGPGDTLLFKADTLGLGSLMIQGTLIVEGNQDSLVVFTGQPDSQFSWPGILFRPLAGDSSTSVIQYAHLNGSNTTLNSNKVAAWGQPYSLVVRRTLITDGSFGAVLFAPSSTRFENCVFDDQRNVSVYASSCLAEVVNCVLMPHEAYPSAKAINFYNPLVDPVSVVHYNLFYPGVGAWWSEFLLSNNTGDSQYTYHLPDSTNLVADPLFLADRPYHPDPEISPLVDGGDPAILDPDETVSDIGIWWVRGIETPLRILSAPSPSTWVQGYNFLALFEIQSYPAPDWSLVGAPEGMAIYTLGRSRAALSWPVSQQQLGVHRFWIHGQNLANEIVYRDSLEVNLLFLENHPPQLSLVSPCDGGDCLDQRDVIVESLSTGTSTLVQLRVEDQDAALLGGLQIYQLDVWVNGVAEPTQFVSQFQREFVLDTTALVLDLRFSDGVAHDSLHYVIHPRYTLLSGDVSGVIGAATGAVFLTGPLRVPAGQTLRLEAGSQLVAGDLESGDWLLDVEGELLLEGSAEAPIVFRCLATQRSGQDLRPPFLRVQQGGRLSGLSHVEFEGFSTAVQLEHLDQTEPVPIDSCSFTRVRLGVLAVNTPVEIRHCVFHPPADSLQLGSSSIYLAGSAGHVIQNNLFVNPIVGVTAVDADARIANNSFVWVKTLSSFGSYLWPTYSQLGFGRVHAFNSALEIRNNLFQWRGTHYGDYLTDSQLEAYAASPTHAIWLDEASRVRAEWNWYDCRNAWLPGEGGYQNLSFQTAINDSTLLLSHIRAGADSAGVDEQNGYRLFADSPLIDAGDPSGLWNDAFDASRCDIGWTGGPLALESEYTAVNDLPGEEPGLTLLPGTFRLKPAYPNPFNPFSRLEVELDRPGVLDLRIYDLLGRQVAVLVHDRLEPGVYGLQVDGSAWASGFYVARARFQGEQQSTRLLLVK